MKSEIPEGLMKSTIRIVSIALFLAIPLTNRSHLTSQSQEPLSRRGYPQGTDPTKEELYRQDRMYLKIMNYERWKKANDAPYKVQSLMYVPGLCRSPFPGEEFAYDSDPHQDFYINVYVNRIGQDAMFTSENPKFPAGSIIVKEKFRKSPADSPTPLRPDLLTVMIKREENFNPECGDWEFAAVSSRLQSIARGRIESCQRCHQNLRNSDHLFRSYIPKEAYTKPAAQK
jgi:hypothetical protein